MWAALSSETLVYYHNPAELDLYLRGEFSEFRRLPLATKYPRSSVSSEQTALEIAGAG
jgi:hypothetical protein